jgi:hypothetical protein
MKRSRLAKRHKVIVETPFSRAVTSYESKAAALEAKRGFTQSFRTLAKKNRAFRGTIHVSIVPE